MARVHGRRVESTLSGFKGQLEHRISIKGGLFAYQISLMMEGLNV